MPRSVTPSTARRAMTDAAQGLGPLHPRGAGDDRLAATALPRESQLELYRALLLNRAVEDRLVNLYRQGKVVGGLYSSRGQEAVSVGAAYALAPQDVLAPLIRNLGALLVRGIRPREIFMQYMARAGSPTGGRDCNLHFGDLARGVVAPISMLGALIPIMAGVGLASRLRRLDTVALTFIGDGGTSTGDFHEGMNLAAVLQVPLVVVAEHNGWSYSTPTARQMRIRDLAQRAAAYGMPATVVDGNDVLAVHAAVSAAVERARAGGGPSMVEAKTFRMKGHAEHDDAAYVPVEQKAEWQRKDPLARCERHLLAAGVASREELAALAAGVQRELDEDVAVALESPFPKPDTAFDGVYEPSEVSA